MTRIQLARRFSILGWVKAIVQFKINPAVVQYLMALSAVLFAFTMFKHDYGWVAGVATVLFVYEACYMCKRFVSWVNQLDKHRAQAKRKEEYLRKRRFRREVLQVVRKDRVKRKYRM